MSAVQNLLAAEFVFERLLENGVFLDWFLKR